MWSDDKIKEYLSKNLKTKRYKHSLGVSETAVKLAKIYGADERKAYIAGLVHDSAKNMSDSEILKIIKDNGFDIDKVSVKMPQLSHGLAGAIIAEKVMEIEDKEILDAVTYHTIGKENMTILEKIIYLADFIEPSRDFPGVNELREISYVDLDKALIKAFESSIRFVLDKNQLLHINTINARNYLIMNK